ncbi:MAG: hypothetical protein ACKVX7_13315 [Planctomycetota bacterium]
MILSESTCRRFALWVGGVFLATSCATRPIQWDRWGLGPVPNDYAEELRARSATLEDEIFARHISAEGLLLYRTPIAAPSPNESYLDLADQACWTGYLFAALCFRYTYEPSPNLAARIRQISIGLERLQSVTGVPGFIARNIVPARALSQLEKNRELYELARDGSGDYFRGETSKDQYSGYVLGLAVGWTCLPNGDERDRCGRLLVASARYLAGNDLHLRDARGARTDFSNLNSHWLGVPIGVNAAIAQALLESAAITTSDVDVNAAALRYRAPALAALQGLCYEVPGARKFSNQLMATAGVISLGLVLGDTEARARVRAGFEPVWRASRGQGNALVYSTGMLFGLRDVDEEARSLRNLYHARFGSRSTAIAREIWRDVPRRWLPDTQGRPLAIEALPVAVRTPSTFCWRTDPFRIDPTNPVPESVRVSGADLLVAYWMGRYCGWIKAP